MVKILVEGYTDKYFIELYLKYLNISKCKVEQVAGKDNLFKYKIEIQRSNDNYFIIFDADDNLDKSKNNIINQLEVDESFFDKIFLFPNNKDTGNLETLIEKIAIHKEVLQCYENYESCIDYLINNKIPDLKHPSKKSKVFAYMSGFGFKNPIDAKSFDLTPYVDFDNIYLNDLKKFLENINF
ncbi:DUF3226 domain-containing protein [Brachyspira hyodysenteriae]|uniref:DUF4435 domain-containing protein n=1 Tax=Brachyspira hyodysenteriae (strain ATCC 49526 / WA1) TaxID=565034 RepID=A0A3B6VAB1_BRAHW|nr:DUF3226 domain-containing protein [Brachyspira hyodysenteriae]ACN84329.1 conserved hypothetical protein [Brachyspira hyodysenteriae WA1]KLI42945.1 hypothetical protein SZ53_05365 [Brachyspira hyodysenteriae]KLI43184.1 hypothetical protein SZ52_05505 [Brachyspira hyodysenteriae]KLI46811.1 hypothetical protein SZ40_04740 [Brachyspira hyodysenteriae]KLI49638.1 hypothetical protein SZ42_07630 [Brachyspira hyodysenteriae]